MFVHLNLLSYCDCILIKFVLTITFIVIMICDNYSIRAVANPKECKYLKYNN